MAIKSKKKKKDHGRVWWFSKPRTNQMIIGVTVRVKHSVKLLYMWYGRVL